MNKFNNLLDEYIIHKPIKSHIYYDTITSYNMYYKNDIKHYNIINTLNKLDTMLLFNYISKKYKIIDNTTFKSFNINNITYNIYDANINYDNNPFNNFFYNINTKSYFYIKDDGSYNEIIDNIDTFYLWAYTHYTDNIMKKLDKTILKHIYNLFIFYLITNNVIIKTIIKKIMEGIETIKYHKRVDEIKQIFKNNIIEHFFIILNSINMYDKFINSSIFTILFVRILLFNKFKFQLINKIKTQISINELLTVINLTYYCDIQIYCHYIKTYYTCDDMITCSEKLKIIESLQQFKNVSNNNNIYNILFYVPDNNYNIESIKLSYIYKKYFYISSDDFKDIFKLFNLILKTCEITWEINENNYFYKLLNTKYISDFQYNKYINISQIKNNYNNNFDDISVKDYQNSFIILYDLLFINNNELDNTDELDIIMNDLLNNILDSLKYKNDNIVDVLNTVCYDDDLSSYLYIDDTNNNPKQDYMKYKNIEEILKQNYFNYSILFDETKDILDIANYYSF